MPNLNHFMHPRNIYKNPVDFTNLSELYPEIREFCCVTLAGKLSFDFSNANGVRTLTRILLKKDFDIDAIIPEGKLVPTLPLRLNYILWLEDLMVENKSLKEIKGIDIGCGATCIYPLLASKLYKWQMLATDINNESVEMARANVKKNSLENLIQVKTVADSSMLAEVIDERETYSFCMCNPPFFSDENDLIMSEKSRTDRRKPPTSTSPTGAKNEIISPGGEVAFITRMIEDSFILLDRIKIYTTMIGIKSSLKIVRKKLVGCDRVSSIAQAQFCQGKVVRWAIAWTFSTEISLTNFMPMKRAESQIKPICANVKQKNSFDEHVKILEMKLRDYKIERRKIRLESDSVEWKIKAYENTWKNQRRKRREMLQKICKLSLDTSLKVEECERTTISKSSSENSASQAADVDMRSVLNGASCDNPTKRTHIRDNQDPPEISCKKPKLDSAECETSNESDNVSGSINRDEDNIDYLENKNPLFAAELKIVSKDDHFSELSITWREGDKNLAHQLLQVLKNALVS